MLTRRFIRHCSRLAATFALVWLASGCATSGNPKDPLEGYNRAMFAFNDGVDRAAIKPLAQGYVAAVPAPVRNSVTNFFGNIADVFTAVNNLLQGKLQEAAGDLGRVTINSTVGLIGLFDFASDVGLEKHDEDFGQTFGRWGIGDGPYVVLPIFGPRTLRDAFAQILDSRTDPVSQLDNVPSRNTLLVTRVISERANFLSAEKIIQEAALDRYAYIRNGYLQRRHSKVYDGNPPPEKDDEEALLETSGRLASGDTPEAARTPVAAGAAADLPAHLAAAQPAESAPKAVSQ